MKGENNMFDKLNLNLQMFNNTNVTTQTGEGQDLSAEMKTYYSNYLIDNAKPELVHDQFAQKHPIPKNGGKTIEFRKYKALQKALTPLTEGVTPNGNKLSVSILTATIAQYGDYIELSDILQLTAIDNNLVQATKLLGNQAGLTLDTITREVMNGGTNVIYSGGKAARSALAAEDKLTVLDIQKAARFLKQQNAKKIDKYFVGIIHPDTEFDLMRDPEWKDASLYAGSTQLFEGEIGKIAGVRFVETTEAKIWEKAAASSSKDVYSTIILGANAYGTTDVEGGGLQHIVKQLGSSGTADPLNQRATAGWKAIKTAERLVEEYMVRIESCSTFDAGAN
jgi:N4-gp56 family major capsid protein|nr:MAG TPA: major capsid protein [Caudoviricetes sp.]